MARLAVCHDGVWLTSVLMSLLLWNSPGPAAAEDVGACCTMNHECMITTQSGCLGGWNLWMGAGVSCYPLPCPNCALPCGNGACCMSDGSCVIGYQEACGYNGGIFQGFTSDCNPDPCQETSVVERSWGEIKSLYR